LEIAYRIGTLSPQARTIGKYSSTGPYSARSFNNHNLPANIMVALVASAIFSLAEGTAKSYGTAESHIIRCQEETKVNLSFPFREKEIVTYIGWLIDKRKVSAKTVEKYLSNIRLAHLKEEYHVPALRPDIAKTGSEGEN
jgi:hypothetical protein